jgi:hypothetical protein
MTADPSANRVWRFCVEWHDRRAAIDARAGVRRVRARVPRSQPHRLAGSFLENLVHALDAAVADLEAERLEAIGFGVALCCGRGLYSAALDALRSRLHAGRRGAAARVVAARAREGSVAEHDARQPRLERSAGRAL